MTKHRRSIALEIKDPEGKTSGVALTSNEYEKLPSDNYVYLFDKDGLDLIKSTGSAATLKIFFALAFSLRGGDSYVYISPMERDRIMSEYDISEATYCAALKELEKKNIIIRGTIVDKVTGEIREKLRQGLIILNPSAAWKGTREDRKVMVEKYNNLVKFSKGELSWDGEGN